MNFLIVDDEKLLLDLFEDEIALSFEGATIHTANNGVEAVELLENNVVDIILTDGRMPKMSGSDLAKVVKDRWPSIPVVLLTGYSGISDDDLKSGLFALSLKKPIRFEDLSKNLEEVLKDIKKDE